MLWVELLLLYSSLWNNDKSDNLKIDLPVQFTARTMLIFLDF